MSVRLGIQSILSSFACSVSRRESTPMRATSTSSAAAVNRAPSASGARCRSAMDQAVGPPSRPVLEVANVDQLRSSRQRPRRLLGDVGMLARCRTGASIGGTLRRDQRHRAASAIDGTSLNIGFAIGAVIGAGRCASRAVDAAHFSIPTNFSNR